MRKPIQDVVCRSICVLLFFYCLMWIRLRSDFSNIIRRNNDSLFINVKNDEFVYGKYGNIPYVPSLDFWNEKISWLRNIPDCQMEQKNGPERFLLHCQNMENTRSAGTPRERISISYVLVHWIFEHIHLLFEFQITYVINIRTYLICT